MSGATVSVNPKLGDGTIVQIGGVGYDDFYANLVGFVGAEAAESIVHAVANRLLPVSVGSPTTVTEQQGEANVRAAFNPQPVQQQAGGVVCPTHQQPAKVVEKKDGSGSFTKCVVNDTIISNWGKPGLKDYCPKPKG